MKDITLFLIYIRDWIPKDSLPYLKESLEKISEEQKQKLLLLKFKNPLYGLLLLFQVWIEFTKAILF